MCRSLLLLVCLVALVGCNRFTGPVETRHKGKVDPQEVDENGNARSIYSIAEQQQRGRERLAITEDDYSIGPNGYISRPSPIGR